MNTYPTEKVDLLNEYDKIMTAFLINILVSFSNFIERFRKTKKEPVNLLHKPGYWTRWPENPNAKKV